MADFNRGIMRFPGADSPLALFISSTIVFGVVGTLIWWALHQAYAG
jgi:hypothetical protein